MLPPSRRPWQPEVCFLAHPPVRQGLLPENVPGLALFLTTYYLLTPQLFIGCWGASPVVLMGSGADGQPRPPWALPSRAGVNADNYPEREVTRGAWPHEGAGERARDPGWVFCLQPRALYPTDLLAGGQRPALCQGPSPLKPAVRASSLSLTPGVTPGPVSGGLVRKFCATLCLRD